MKKTMLSLSLAGACALSACNANPFAGVVPSKGQVRLNVPGATEDGAQALLAGAQSEFYVSTLNIANTVNGGVGFVFRIVEEISGLPPTETDNETFAVWGPSEPRGLERNSFRFTVNKGDDESFAYKLEARAKDQTAEEDFVVAFEGIAFPGEDDKGHGSLDVHWGALRSLDDTQCLVGDLHVDYAADEEPRRLDVSFVEVADGCRDETPTNATYQYLEAADASGQLDFAFQANMHKVEEDKPLEEIFAVRSRWQGDGRGRSDVRLSEGEIPADLALNIPGTAALSADLVECWDANFDVVFVDTAPAELEPHLGHAEEGDVALCAYADASFAEL
ncbi:MAG: hypothetical protein Q8O67_10270 [Deltaproteobacteria bacterium]|nr:hypothetical protein [Deltaproteobacteria bacterium]